MLKIARKAAKNILPTPVVYRLKRQIEKNRFQRYAQEKLELNYRPVSPSGSSSLN